jgi:DedD protein
MARPISDEELQLKKRARRRLVGAVVLVSAVAVILPMVLDSEPKPVNKNVDIQIPPSDSTDFKTKAAPPAPVSVEVTPPVSAGSAPAPAAALPDTDAEASNAGPTTAGTGQSLTKSASGSPTASTERTSADEEPAKHAVTRAESEAKQKTAERAEDHKSTAKASKETPASAGAYIVQVAALADTARVKQVRKQIAGAGVKSYVEVVSTKTGDVTRIRAGPYSTREAAEKARSQLKKVGLDGKVVPK